ncbi:MAG: hypothetical protein ATN34_03365 [Epulopiscium sp. Nele67-Bin002]|nr:MAG: hypothetical protein BEN18_07215 [Epulopiscium sp. Nuni2H_MBin001]OON90796.1 MAG: hypothetical protein ATN34_03365 [Epulopiscium sp. Nele67-Bin002]
MMKKWLIGAMIISTALSLGTVYAKDGSHCKKKEDIEQQAKEAGLSVEDYKEKMHAEHSKEAEAIISRGAEAAGISVSEYKERVLAEHEAELAKKAAEEGISVDELKQQHHHKHLTKRAEEEGISADELKAKMDEKVAEHAKEAGLSVEDYKKEMEIHRIIMRNSKSK